MKNPASPLDESRIPSIIASRAACRRPRTPIAMQAMAASQRLRQALRASAAKTRQKALEAAAQARLRLQTRLAKTAMEGLSLAAFMMVLAGGAVALEHPASPLHRMVPQPVFRRALMGLLAGGWLLGLIYSAWGQKSGAHINPAVTLAMFRLNRIGPKDAACYIGAQAVGAILGMQVASFIWGEYLSLPAINYAATTPGQAGTWVAFGIETLLSFVLMGSIIFTSDRKGWQRTTGLLVGLFILTLTVVAAPLSGLSLNPARTLGSAVAARDFTGLWLYFVGPTLGMQLAVELMRRRDIRRALSLRGKT